MAISIQQKVFENRLRRAASRQGLVLLKSLRRDPLAIDFEHWRLIDEKGYDLPGTTWSRLEYSWHTMDVAKRLGVPPLQTEGSEARERIRKAEMTPEDRVHERVAEKDFILESEGGPPGHWKLIHTKSGRVLGNGPKGVWWSESDLRAGGVC